MTVGTLYMSHRQGFTLIEMLVVLTIIGVLIGVGSISYAAVQRNVRDTKRKADIKYIQSSLEQYSSICGTAYPTPDAGHLRQPIFCTSPTVVIAPTVPVDPVSIATYSYSNDVVNNTYSVCATLEDSTLYCLQNQQ